MRCCKAWDRAADDGFVRTSLPCGRAGRPSCRTRTSGPGRGHPPTKTLEAAENPTPLRAAIPADPATARTARAALLDRVPEDPELPDEPVRDVVRTDDLEKAVGTGSRASDRIGYVRQIAGAGGNPPPG